MPTNDRTQLNIIESELATKKKCYFICTHYCDADFFDVLERCTATAVLHGANHVYLTCREQTPFTSSGSLENGTFELNHYTDFILLEKDLQMDQTFYEPIRLKPLSANASMMYADIHNAAFFDVPNSMTVTESELEAILSDERRKAGFVIADCGVVGTYEVDLSFEVPELASLAILPEYQRCGYGRRALSMMERLVIKENHVKARILVADINRHACKLYVDLGYSKACIHSRWFEVHMRR